MLRILLISLLLLVAGCGTTNGKLRLVTLDNSKHLNTDKEYNESHDGLGFEYKITETLYLGLVHYTNSSYNPSRMITLTQENSAGKRLTWGPFIAIADGYGKYEGDTDLVGIGGIAASYKLFDNFFIRINFTPILLSQGWLIDL